MRITEIHIALAEVLLENINQEKNNAMIKYKDMCEKANNIIDPRGSAGYLGDLSEFCYENKLPLISAMVVNEKEYMPGAGFFRLYTDLTGKEVEDKNELFKSELKKVREYDNWNKLINLLGLDTKLLDNNDKVKTITQQNKNNNILNANDSKKEKEKIYEEGQIKLKEHQSVEKRERNQKVIKDAKVMFIKKYGHLYCELCGFDFENIYGKLGERFIEGHHVNPISQMKEGDVTRISDIKMLCPNCHRMVHRGISRGISIDDIKNILK